MSQRIIEFIREEEEQTVNGRADDDATATDPANFDPNAAQGVLPRDFKRIVYKSKYGRGRDVTPGRIMDMPFKDGLEDIHKGLGLKGAMREAIGNNDIMLMSKLIDALANSQEFGDSIDMRLTPFGYTAMHLACKHGQDKMVSLLLDRKASVHCLTQNRDSPLHLAVRSGHNMMRSVRALLHAKADVNVRSRLTRRTALHWACITDGQLRAACAIANYTTSFDVPDCDGFTVVDYAKKNNLSDVLDVIAYVQSEANQLAVKKLQMLGQVGKKKMLTRQQKMLLSAGGKVGFNGPMLVWTFVARG